MVFIILHGKPRMGGIAKDYQCLIKTAKTENITHKHNMT